MTSLKASEAVQGPAEPARAAGTAAPYPKRWAAAWVMILAALLDMIDGSIVNTALPSIGRGLHASSAQLQWTVSAYMLGFAATLIIAGHLGDRYGRKKLFLAGVAAFAVASLASAMAPDAGALVAFRAIQGVTAAILTPQILASFRTMFDGEERGKAFALYGAVAGISTAAGVLLGGVLTDWSPFGWGWRTIFVVNLPLAALVLVLGVLWIPSSKDDGFRGRIDIAGSVVLAGSLVAIVLPLVQGRGNGWPAWGWILLAAGVAALIGLAWSEKARHVEHPLLNAGLFAKPAFSGGLLIQMLFYGAMSGFMLTFTIWLQSGQGYSPAQAGLLMVAFSGGAILGAPVVDALVAKLRRNILILGAASMAGGFYWVQHAVGHSAPGAHQRLAAGSRPDPGRHWPDLPGHPAGQHHLVDRAARTRRRCVGNLVHRAAVRRRPRHRGHRQRVLLRRRPGPDQGLRPRRPLGGRRLHRLRPAVPGAAPEGRHQRPDRVTPSPLVPGEAGAAHDGDPAGGDESVESRGEEHMRQAEDADAQAAGQPSEGAGDRRGAHENG